MRNVSILTFILHFIVKLEDKISLIPEEEALVLVKSQLWNS